MSKKTNDLWIACDLGSSNTCVSLYDQNGIPRSISTEARSVTFPSVVYYPKKSSEEILVARLAQLKGVKDPSQMIYAAKRLIGRSWADPVVQQCAKSFPFNIEEDPDSNTPVIRIQVDGKFQYISPVEVQAQILKYARSITAKEIQYDVLENIVITVPAYFTHHQRYETIEAAKLAGFKEIRVINEPSAAAFYAGWLKEKQDVQSENVLVFDFGAGTLDISIISTQHPSGPGGEVVYRVLATDGNVNFGGFDVDRYVMAHFKHQVRKLLEKKLKSKPEIDAQLGLMFSLTSNLAKIQKLAEEIKKSLSHAASLEETINLTNPTDGEVEEYDVKVDRPALSRFFQNKSIGYRLSAEAIQRCLTKAGKTHADISQIILVGGSTRIAQVPKMLVEIFGGRDIIARTVNADQAVSFGGALWSAALSSSPLQKLSKSMQLTDIAPLSYSIKFLTTEINKPATMNAATGLSIEDAMPNYYTKRFIQKNAVLQKGKDIVVTHDVVITPSLSTVNVLLFESDDTNNNNSNATGDNSQNKDPEVEYQTYDQNSVNLCLYTLALTNLTPKQQYKFKITITLTYEYDLYFTVHDVTNPSQAIPVLATTKLTPSNEQGEYNFNKDKSQKSSQPLRKHSTFQILQELKPDANGLIHGKPPAYWIKANWEEIPAIPSYWENTVTGDVSYFEEFFDIRNFRHGL